MDGMLHLKDVYISIVVNPMGSISTSTGTVRNLIKWNFCIMYKKIDLLNLKKEIYLLVCNSFLLITKASMYILQSIDCLMKEWMEPR